MLLLLALVYFLIISLLFFRIIFVDYLLHMLASMDAIHYMNKFYISLTNVKEYCVSLFTLSCATTQLSYN